VATVRPTSIEARLRDDRSQGALAVVENVLAAETAGPPLHVSPSLDETFYVLEGTASFRVGEALFTALPGASVFVPRGTPHTYANPSSQRARLLLVCTPGPDHAFADDSSHFSRIVGEALSS
jgi:quercetin dioxygenase-like cupin family protein